MSTTTITLITLIAYQGILLGIGFWAKGRTRNERDFFLGGRNVGPFITAMSYGASSSSAWVLLGLTGYVYTTGLAALWILPGVWAGYIVVWLFIGPGLRRAAGQHDLVTLTDYLAHGTAGTARKTIIALAAFMIIFSFSFYVAGQFQGAGTAFASAFDLPMSLSVLIGASVVLLYTWLGGFWAVSVTDAVQATLMLVVAIILPIAAIAALGGPGAFWQAVFTQEASTSAPGAASLAGLGFIIGSLGIGIGPVGQPQLLTRLMAIKSEADIRRGFALAFGWAVVVFSAMAILGLSARALIAPGTDNTEGVFFALSYTVLPGVLAGIVLAAVLSAIMSTADSLLLVAGSAAAHDLGLARRFPRHALFISRLMTAFLCVAAAALTLALPASIYGRVLFAWSALGAAFGPLVIAMAMGRPARPAGVIIAMICGFTLTVVFYLQPNTPGDWLERVVPFALALLITLLMPAKRA
jgi:sodium/proline symporter